MKRKTMKHYVMPIDGSLMCNRGRTATAAQKCRKGDDVDCPKCLRMTRDNMMALQQVDFKENSAIRDNLSVARKENDRLIKVVREKDERIAAMETAGEEIEIEKLRMQDAVNAANMRAAAAERKLAVTHLMRGQTSDACYSEESWCGGKWNHTSPMTQEIEEATCADCLRVALDRERKRRQEEVRELDKQLGDEMDSRTAAESERDALRKAARALSAAAGHLVG